MAVLINYTTLLFDPKKFQMSKCGYKTRQRNSVSFVNISFLTFKFKTSSLVIIQY